MADHFPFVSITEYLIEKKPDLKAGKASLLDYLARQYPDYHLRNVKAANFFSAQDTFEQWILDVIANEPIPSDIKSIWFGLSEWNHQAEPDVVFTRIYIIGSRFSPDEDKEWSCYVHYDPDPKDSLLELEIYEDMSRSVSQYNKWAEGGESVYLGVAMFLSLSCLLITQSLQGISDILIENRDDLHVGFGYPSGDCWYLGRLTADGWE